MFKEELFKKILTGEKAQTRRIIKPQPKRKTGKAFEEWFMEISPRYKMGETYYLKEPCGRINGIMFYKYDYPSDSPMRKDFKGWGNKMFHKAENARFKIQITAVTVQMVREITEEDAIREGFENLAGFQNAWIRINGISSWKKNPWVFVYEFKRV